MGAGGRGRRVVRVPLLERSLWQAEEFRKADGGDEICDEGWRGDGAERPDVNSRGGVPQDALWMQGQVPEHPGFLIWRMV